MGQEFGSRVLPSSWPGCQSFQTGPLSLLDPVKIMYLKINEPGTERRRGLPQSEEDMAPSEGLSLKLLTAGREGSGC